MTNNKLGKYILCGALLGAVLSLFDRGTRDQMKRRSKGFASDITFYTKNPTILKLKTKEKGDKLQSIYEQLSGDVLYIKEKVEELKLLSPQVKGLVTETRDAFTDAKDEYQSIVSESPAETN